MLDNLCINMIKVIRISINWDSSIVEGIIRVTGCPLNLPHLLLQLLRLLIIQLQQIFIEMCKTPLTSSPLINEVQVLQHFKDELNLYSSSNFKAILQRLLRVHDPLRVIVAHRLLILPDQLLIKTIVTDNIRQQQPRLVKHLRQLDLSCHGTAHPIDEGKGQLVETDAAVAVLILPVSD
jgi:hypothetical protein